LKIESKNANDSSIAAAQRFAETHDPDPAHAFQVTKNSLVLFDALRGLHGLGDRERVLLHAAALMHDTGYETTPLQHHKRSRDLILASKLEGFSPKELAIIACVARYHRKAGPEPSHKVYRNLDKASRLVVNKLAALLRVADGLDRSHAESAESLKVTNVGGAIRVKVKQRTPNPIDLAAGARKADLFEAVFGVKLVISR
jgi:exopolyphosphatase/guanosine-5'-triphosphate,3'-diphosphate pyrophosphatase